MTTKKADNTKVYWGFVKYLVVSRSILGPLQALIVSGPPARCALPGPDGRVSRGTSEEGTPERQGRGRGEDQEDEEVCAGYDGASAAAGRRGDAHELLCDCVCGVRSADRQGQGLVHVVHRTDSVLPGWCIIWCEEAG